MFLYQALHYFKPLLLVLFQGCKSFSLQFELNKHNEKVKQTTTTTNPSWPRRGRKGMWLVLWSVSRFPLNCETPYATLKRHFSQMICPLLSHSLLLQLAWVFFLSLHPSVYSGSGVFSLLFLFLSLPSKSSNLQTSFYRCTKAAMFVFVSCLLSLVSLMYWQSAEHPASTFSARPSSPPPDCNNVSKCGSACCWMETLFYTTCHLSNPQLSAGGAEAQGSELACLQWEDGLATRWASQTTFQWFNFTYGGWKTYIPGVFVTLWANVWWGVW